MWLLQVGVPVKVLWGYFLTVTGATTPGGTDLERGYGDVRPWRPPFHASPAARKGPISSKRVSSQDPLLRKFWNFSLYSLNFHPSFSSQAPKFGNFQLTNPQIWKFSAHKPPFSEANISSQAPHFGNPGRTPLPEKKLSSPPPGATTHAAVAVEHSLPSKVLWLAVVTVVNTALYDIYVAVGIIWICTRFLNCWNIRFLLSL